MLTDSIILYSLYKRAHWLTCGNTFEQSYLLLDIHAGEQLTLINLPRERVRTLGGHCCVEHYLRLETKTMITNMLTAKTNTLTPELLHKIDAYWRAANYLSVGQIYLYDNPLLKQPLKLSHVKPLVVGHWGTTPGQNFIYVHLNRVIKKYDLNMFYIAGPGHGGPALVGNTYLEGSYSEILYIN